MASTQQKRPLLTSPTSAVPPQKQPRSCLRKNSAASGAAKVSFAPAVTVLEGDARIDKPLSCLSLEEAPLDDVGALLQGAAFILGQAAALEEEAALLELQTAEFLSAAP